MTKEEFSILAKALKAIYPDPKFLPGDEAKELWYGLLRDLDYETANKAIMRYMQTRQFPPYPADIRGIAAEILSEGDEDDGLRAWHKVRKALNNSAYNSREEFAKLDAPSRHILGGASALRDMMMLTNESLETVEKSHFIKAYNGYKARLRTERMTVIKTMTEEALPDFGKTEAIPISGRENSGFSENVELKMRDLMRELREGTGKMP